MYFLDVNGAEKLNTSLPARHDEVEALGLIPEEFFGKLDMTYIIPFNTGAMRNVAEENKRVTLCVNMGKIYSYQR